MRRLWIVCLLVLLAFVSLPISGTSASAQQPASTPNASSITIITSPASLRVEVNGTPATAPLSFSCDPGTNRTINAPSPQVNGSTRYRFLNWSDGGSQFHQIDCAVSGNYTAYFSQEYALSVDTNPSGLTVEVDGVAYAAPASVWCVSGSIQGVNAPSPQGSNTTQFIFLSWSDGGAIGHTVLCDAPRSLVAFFRMRFTIGIFSNIQQPFLVQINGIPRVLPEAYVCEFGRNFTLFVVNTQTVSGSTWRFTGWSDSGPNPRTVSCDGPRNYTANFERENVPGPNPPPSPPIVPLAIIAIVVTLVVLLGVVLWLTNRRRSPTVAVAPPPVPLRVETPASLANRCANCGNPVAQDWTFCMMCGASLR